MWTTCLSIAWCLAVLAKVPRPTLLTRIACILLKACARVPIAEAPVVTGSLWVAEALALRPVPRRLTHRAARPREAFLADTFSLCPAVACIQAARLGRALGETVLAIQVLLTLGTVWAGQAALAHTGSDLGAVALAATRLERITRCLAVLAEESRPACLTRVAHVPIATFTTGIACKPPEPSALRVCVRLLALAAKPPVTADITLRPHPPLLAYAPLSAAPPMLPACVTLAHHVTRLSNLPLGTRQTVVPSKAVEASARLAVAGQSSSFSAIHGCLLAPFSEHPLTTRIALQTHPPVLASALAIHRAPSMWATCLSIAWCLAILAKIPRPTLLTRIACKLLKACARVPIAEAPVVTGSLWVAQALALRPVQRGLTH